MRRCDADNAGTPQLAMMSLTPGPRPSQDGGRGVRGADRAVLRADQTLPVALAELKSASGAPSSGSAPPVPEHLTPVRLRQILPAGEHL